MEKKEGGKLNLDSYPRSHRLPKNQRSHNFEGQYKYYPNFSDT
jgi:hypothetical protein